MNVGTARQATHRKSPEAPIRGHADASGGGLVDDRCPKGPAHSVIIPRLKGVNVLPPGLLSTAEALVYSPLNFEPERCGAV